MALFWHVSEEVEGKRSWKMLNNQRSRRLGEKAARLVIKGTCILVLEGSMWQWLRNDEYALHATGVAGGRDGGKGMTGR